MPPLLSVRSVAPLEPVSLMLMFCGYPPVADGVDVSVRPPLPSAVTPLVDDDDEVPEAVEVPEPTVSATPPDDEEPAVGTTM